MLTSIIINNYNYDEFLEEAILSGLNQTSESSVEVVVVDDGSTDDSRQLIEAYQNKLISVLKPNGGQASAFNAGFEACKGDIILFLDSDDFFYPNKVSQVVDIFHKYPDAGWYFHELQDVDKKGFPLKRHHRHRISQFEFVDLRHILLGGKQFSHWFPATSGLCFRRETLEAILPMPDAFKVAADSFLRLSAIYSKSGILSPDLFAVHRQHGENLYDFRDDIHIKRAENGIRSAYYLRQRFPKTYRFSNRQFCFCFGQHIEYTDLIKTIAIPEVRRYLYKEISPAFQARFAAYMAKGLFRRKSNK